MIKAKEIMSKDVITISPDATLVDAIELLITKEISGMPVINAKNKIIGIITEKDLINFAFSGNLRNTKVKEAMSTKVTTFSPDANVDEIAIAIAHNKFRRVPIVENDEVLGIISRRDIIRVALKI
ncbi:MAG: CBS domain-containing protein [Endomicrobiales bacterium]|nr:CBS domain-containing protein [Endomicrobiales bacterium]